MQILIYDTSIASSNLGDEIIMDAVVSELTGIFPNEHTVHTATHDIIGRASYRLARSASYSFVGGTNLLSSNMNWYNQWKINWYDSLFLNNILLMGVGWWQYQSNPNFYTRKLLRRVLSCKLLHSVRDEYTFDKLRNVGFINVINTGCPTMWQLSNEHCLCIPAKNASSVVFTLTDYNKDIEADRYLIKVLLKNYETVYFWPQGDGDSSYLRDFDFNDIVVLPRNLASLDALLSREQSLEYIGTRLHAGVRALQHKRRAIIIGIDNRSTEISRDTGLLILQRNGIRDLDYLLKQQFETNLKINFDNINLWRNQFSV